MARTVRKVSRASTKNQKSFKLSKKWWIVIASVVGAIIIGLGIGLGVHFANQEETYVSEKVYFADPVKNTNGVEVSFIKENHQTLVRYIDADTYEHILVFAYDSNAFYADEEAVDNGLYTNATYLEYQKLITRLADLQSEVDAAKSRGVSIELFIIDVSINSYTNADILFDSENFGGLVTEELSTYSPAFFYNQEGEFKSEVEINEVSKNISSSSLSTILNPSFINNAINYVKSL